MNKEEAIHIANESMRSTAVNSANTQFSQVVRFTANPVANPAAKPGIDEGWWLNIPLSNFRKECHFLLCSEKARMVIHLTLKPNAILSPATKFRVKDGIADVFISASQPKRLADKLTGGTKYSFNKHRVDEYRY